jgi:hypothetical protein
MLRICWSLIKDYLFLIVLLVAAFFLPSAAERDAPQS